MGELVSSDSPLGDLPRDATLVVAGPPMTGKYALMLSILAHYAEDAIVISTKNDASRVVADLEDVAGDSRPGRIGVVDCLAPAGGLEAPETELLKHAGSPENLTRIGVKFTELFEVMYDPDSEANVGVGVHSISQLLMHSGLKNVYQFLQVLTGQVRSADWLCVGVVDTNTDEEELHTFYQHCDGIVETRANGGCERELRVRGLSPRVSDWTAF